jgi:hypothetical protein
MFLSVKFDDGEGNNVSYSLKASQGLCRAGLSRCDITPPVGIYHRMWGAATHDRSTGLRQSR